jgi:hypothetical protein
MADTFTVWLPGNWRQRWPEVRDAARKYNFKVNKTGNDIEFVGMGVAGSIRVNGNKAHVTLEKKPFFVSKGMIVGKVRDFLTRYA